GYGDKMIRVWKLDPEILLHAAASSEITGKAVTGDYDVFLSYNSKDRDAVREIAQKLTEKGIRPWLDQWELPPGSDFPEELEKRLNSRKFQSAAVFVGPKGGGPWQNEEIKALIIKFVERKFPIIPVILSGTTRPRIPLFLQKYGRV